MSTTVRITIRKAGGSLITTIPKEVVEREGYRPGEVVVATFGRRKEAFEELWGSLRGIGPWDRSWTRGRDRY